MKLSHVLLGVLVSLLWGANFVAARYGLEELEPVTLTLLRFALVGLILLPFVKFPAGRLKEIFLLSITLGVGHFICLFTALKMGLDIATTVVAGQLGVPFACLLSVIFLGDSIGKWRSIGLLVSFSGVLLLAGTPDVTGNFTAFMLVVLAAFAWGIANLVMKKLDDIPILSILCWMALFATPQLLAAAFITEADSLHHITSLSVKGILSVGYTAFFSTIVAYSIWYYLIRKYPISHVAPFMLLIPIFGGAFGIVLFGEIMTPLKIAGSLLTLAGVGIIILRRPRTAIQEG